MSPIVSAGTLHLFFTPNLEEDKMRKIVMVLVALVVIASMVMALSLIHI